MISDFIYLIRDRTCVTVKPGIAAELRKTIDAKGVEAAKTLFYDLKENKPDEYDFSEEDINTLGYSYMEKNLEAALAIFKMNVDMFPASSNVYDSYGEALLKNGDKDLAIENYKKSVEINPGNSNGIQALEKMGVKIPDRRCGSTGSNIRHLCWHLRVGSWFQYSDYP